MVLGKTFEPRNSSGQEQSGRGLRHLFMKKAYVAALQRYRYLDRGHYGLQLSPFFLVHFPARPTGPLAGSQETRCWSDFDFFPLIDNLRFCMASFNRPVLIEEPEEPVRVRASFFFVAFPFFFSLPFCGSQLPVYAVAGLACWRLLLLRAVEPS